MKKVQLFIFDGQTDTLLATLSNKSNKQLSVYDDEHTEQLNKDFTYDFSVPMTHKDAKHLVKGNRVVFKDKDGDFQEFQIYKTEEEHGTDTASILVQTEHAIYEIVDDIVEDLRVRDGNIKEALTKGLSQSRWEVGFVDEMGKGTVAFYYSNGMENLAAIADTYGNEYKFRLVLSADKKRIASRYVDSLIRRGKETAKRLEFTKDLVSIKRTVDMSGIKTALYGRGSGEETDNNGYSRKETFADVVWSKKNGDPLDKPKGQEWIGDPVALKQFGRVGGTRHRFGTFDVDSTDPKEILEATYRQLLEVNKVLVTYEAEAQALEYFGLDHEKVRLGDTIFVIDKSFTPQLRVTARVIEIKQSLFDPTKLVFVLGNFLPKSTDTALELDELKTKFNDRKGVWDKSENAKVTDSKIEDILPEAPKNAVANGLFQSITVDWSFDSAIHIAAYEVFASTTQGFTPSSATLVFRGKVGGFVHTVNTNETWYYRVRAVNTHGRGSEYTAELKASTARIQSEEIFFGEEVAAELRKLSETAGILGKGTVYMDSIRGEVLKKLEDDARKYSQEEIVATELALMQELADKAGVEYVDGRFELADNSLSKLMNEVSGLEELANTLEGRVADNLEALEANGGKLVTMTSEIDEVKGSLSSTINKLSTAEGRITSTQTQLNATSDALKAKAEKSQVDNLSGSVTNLSTNLGIQAGKIEAKAEKTQVDKVAGDLNTVSNQMSTLSVDVKGVKTQVESLKTTTGSNMLSDGNFEMNGQGWSGMESSKVSFVSDTPTVGKAIRISVAGTSTNSFGQIVPVREGNQYRFGYWYKTSSDANGTSNNQKLRIGHRNGSLLSSTGWSGAATSWTFVEYDWKAPSGVTSVQISFVNNHTVGWVMWAGIEMTDVTETVKLGTSFTQLDKEVKTKAESTRVQSLEGKVTQVESNYSSLTVGVNGIKSEVQSLSSDVKDWEVGTRNLISNSNFDDGLNTWRNWGNASGTRQHNRITTLSGFSNGFLFTATSTGEMGYAQDQVPTIKGQTYTLSAWIRVINGSGYVKVQEGHPDFGWTSSDYDANVDKTQWRRIIHTFTAKENYTHIYVGQSNTSGYCSAYVTGVMLVAGNKVTDWSPAPEDTTDRVSKAETSITQLDKEITQKATTTSVNALTGRMSTAEGSIRTMSSNINLKVNKDDLISEINLSPGTIKLDARMIEVGDFTNLVDNGTFENDTVGQMARGWINQNPSDVRAEVYNQSTWGANNGSTMTFGIFESKARNSDILQERMIQVKEGDNFYFDGEYRNHDLSNQGDSTIRWGFRLYKPDMSHHSWKQVAATTEKTYGWKSIGGHMEIPSGVGYARVWICITSPTGSATNRVYFDNLVVRRKVDISMIVNGSIIASHMTANSITAGNGAIANAAITRANLQNAIIGNAQIENGAVNNAKIANLSADKINAGTIRSINIEGVTVRGSTIISNAGNNTTTIQGGYVESSGRYTRSWRGSPNRTSQVDLRLENGYFRARNNTLGYSLYFSDFGISTYADGVGNDNASGTIAFRDETYGSAGGVTMHSTYGAVALRSDNARVVIDAALTANIESDQFSVYLRPYKNTRSGLNEFQFAVKDNSSASDTDGWIAYGNMTGGATHGSGIRFSKQSSNPTIYITNNSGDMGTGNLDANNMRLRGNLRLGWDYEQVDGSIYYKNTDEEVRVRTGGNWFDLYRNGSGGGTLNSGKYLSAGGIRTTSTNFYIGVPSGSANGEVRVTNNNGYNGGGSIGYRPIRASSFITASSRTYKENIEKLICRGVEVLNELTVVSYDLKDDNGQGERYVGLIAEDSPSVVTSDGMAIDTNKLIHLNVKATQELSLSVEDLKDDVDLLKIENQILKSKIKKLEGDR